MDRLGSNFGTYTIYMLLLLILLYSNPKSFVNFLLPSERVRGGLGWGKKFTTPARIAISSEKFRLFTPSCSTNFSSNRGYLSSCDMRIIN